MVMQSNVVCFGTKSESRQDLKKGVGLVFIAIFLFFCR